MILWTIKLLSSVRHAIAGRKYPAQLAWAVAFGLLLGIVPHGNLIAIGLLLVVLTLKINHAMAGLAAVAATFVATKLDPYSHQLGDFVLTHPQLSDHAAGAWQLPLMPWTDLNNTVVMGSLLIGVTALVPVFVITYPIFRMLAPSQSNSDDGDGQGAATSTHVRPESTHQVVMVDQGHDGVSYAAHDSAPLRELPSAEAGAHQEVDFVEVGDDAEPADAENRIAVETRIDVIRMQDHRGTESASQDADASNEQQPMDEALNYLLRQLRDSKQRKAA